MVGVCFLWQLVIIIAYAAEHSLNNRTVTIKRSAMFKQRSAKALQLSVVDVIVLFLCLVQHLSWTFNFPLCHLDHLGLLLSRHPISSLDCSRSRKSCHWSIHYTWAKVASRPKFWPRPWSRPQSFSLGLGFSLKPLASAWPRSAAEEPAAKKKSTDQSVCTLVCRIQDITLCMVEDSYCVRQN